MTWWISNSTFQSKVIFSFYVFLCFNAFDRFVSPIFIFRPRIWRIFAGIWEISWFQTRILLFFRNEIQILNGLNTKYDVFYCRFQFSFSDPEPEDSEESLLESEESADSELESFCFFEMKFKSWMAETQHTKCSISKSTMKQLVNHGPKKLTRKKIRKSEDMMIFKYIQK